MHAQHCAAQLGLGPRLPERPRTKRCPQLQRGVCAVLRNASSAAPAPHCEAVLRRLQIDAGHCAVAADRPLNRTASDATDAGHAEAAPMRADTTAAATLAGVALLLPLALPLGAGAADVAVGEVAAGVQETWRVLLLNPLSLTFAAFLTYRAIENSGYVISQAVLLPMVLAAAIVALITNIDQLPAVWAMLNEYVGEHPVGFVLFIGFATFLFRSPVALATAAVAGLAYLESWGPEIDVKKLPTVRRGGSHCHEEKEGTTLHARHFNPLQVAVALEDATFDATRAAGANLARMGQNTVAATNRAAAEAVGGAVSSAGEVVSIAASNLPVAPEVKETAAAVVPVVRQAAAGGLAVGAGGLQAAAGTLAASAGSLDAVAGSLAASAGGLKGAAGGLAAVAGSLQAAAGSLAAAPLPDAGVAGAGVAVAAAPEPAAVTQAAAALADAAVAAAAPGGVPEPAATVAVVPEVEVGAEPEAAAGPAVQAGSSTAARVERSAWSDADAALP